jgi:hypothetical protein
LLDLEGENPKQFALKIAHRMWDNQTLSKHRIPDREDGRSAKSKRTPFTEAEDLVKIKILKKALRNKFNLDGEQFGIVWKECRLCINCIGKNFKNRTKTD